MLADVELEIANGNLWLSFTPKIEAKFNSENLDDRIRDLLVTTCAAIVLYNLFLVDDWLSLHDRFKEMLIARALIFTPILIAMIVVGYRLRQRITMEWLAAAGGVLGVLLPMSVMVFSGSPHRLSFQYGSVLVMMFSTVIQRVRFRPATTSIFMMLVIQLTAVYVSKAFDFETCVAIVSFYSSAAILLLIALYLMEHASRRTFLFALRGRLLQDQLQLIARTDSLTGLHNRRYLAEVIQELWTRSDPICVSAILLDIDHFKLFNDSCGHLRGDECLRTVSACIMRVTEDVGGTTFRFGGEEMLILLPGTDFLHARRVAGDIRREIATAAIPHPALGHGAFVTANFGISSVMVPAVTATDLLDAADTALYGAKRAGRNLIWPRSASLGTRTRADRAFNRCPPEPSAVSSPAAAAMARARR